MGILGRMKEMKAASDLGYCLGEEIYKSGLEIDEVSGTTMTHLAEENGVDLGDQTNAMCFSGGLSSGYADAEEEANPSPWWKFW